MTERGGHQIVTDILLPKYQQCYSLLSSFYVGVFDWEACDGYPAFIRSLSLVEEVTAESRVHLKWDWWIRHLPSNIHQELANYQCLPCYKWLSEIWWWNIKKFSMISASNESIMLLNYILHRNFDHQKLQELCSQIWPQVYYFTGTRLQNLFS